MPTDIQAAGSRNVDQYYALRGQTRPGASVEKSAETKPAEAKAAPTGKEALQGALTKASDKAQDFLGEADKKLSSEIETAAKNGDFSEVKRLTEKQGELRKVIADTNKAFESQSADLKDRLKVGGDKAKTADQSTAAAGGPAAKAGTAAPAQDKTLEVLGDADKKLTKDIEAAAKRGDTRQVAQLTQQQSQLRE